MKTRLVLAVLALATLMSGCVVVPARGPGYYGPGYHYGPGYYRGYDNYRGYYGRGYYRY